MKQENRFCSPGVAVARTLAIGLAFLLSAAGGGAQEFGAPTVIPAPDPDLDGGFGLAVAIDGNRLAVGAPYSPEGGVVYVYQRRRSEPTEWRLMAMVTGQNPADDERFGAAVALEGDTLVVGSPDEDARAPNSGAAYVFYRNRGGPDNWGYVRALLPKPLAAQAHLGSSVSLSGDLAAAAAPGVDTVYVHERNGPVRNWWGLQAALQGKVTSRDLLSKVYDPTDPAPYFGRVVALSGKTLVVGAYNPGGFFAGPEESYGVYIFDLVEDEESGTASWVQRFNFAAPHGKTQFGSLLALDGPVFLAGGEHHAFSRLFLMPINRSGCHIYERNHRGRNRWGYRIELADQGSEMHHLHGLAVRGKTIAVGTTFGLPGDLEEVHAGALVYERHTPNRDNWSLLARAWNPDVRRHVESVAIGPREIVTGHEGVVQVFPRAPIMAADFENGDTAGLDNVRGNVEVVSPGLADSDYTLAVTVDGTDTLSFVRSRQPKRDTTLSLSFELAMNRVDLGERAVDVVHLYSPSRSIVRMTLEAHPVKDGYWAKLWAWEQDGTWRELGQSWMPAAGSARMAIEWRAATGPGARNGRARLLRNDRVRAQALDLDTDRLFVNGLMLGLPAGSAGTVGGTFLIDGIELHR